MQRFTKLLSARGQQRRQTRHISAKWVNFTGVVRVLLELTIMVNWLEQGASGKEPICQRRRQNRCRFDP